MTTPAPPTHLPRDALERLRRTEAELKLAYLAVDHADTRHRLARIEADYAHAQARAQLQAAVAQARGAYQQVVLELDSRYCIDLQHTSYDPDTGELRPLPEESPP